MSVLDCVTEGPFDILGNAKLGCSQVSSEKTGVFHVISQTDSLKQQPAFVQFVFIEVYPGFENNSEAMDTIFVADVCRKVQSVCMIYFIKIWLSTEHSV